MLGNTDLVGKLGSLTAPLSNWMNEIAAHRALMQAVVGIHKDRNLPKFHRETFSKWFSKRQRDAAGGGRGGRRADAVGQAATGGHEAAERPRSPSSAPRTHGVGPSASPAAA